jgi:MHS family proline/betaine transporter-like MFS transporter
MAFTAELHHDPAEHQTRQRRRAIIAAAGGSMIESYDNYLYALVVVAVSASLFPAGVGGPLAGLATFAVSFVTRPVGAVIFGLIADRRGRRSALILALAGMSLGTVLVGVLPSYASVGLLAPVLLVVLRLLQGLSMGGELGSAAVFIGEYTPRAKRGFYSSFTFMASQFGNVVAGAIVLILQFSMSPAGFEAWGWRIVFWLAAVPAVAIIYMRLTVEETPLFRSIDKAGVPKRVSLGYTLKHNWLRITQVALVTGIAAPFYLVPAYLPIYFAKAGLTEVGATLAVLIISVVLTALTPLAGVLGDRIGRKRELVLSGAAMVVLVIPAFILAGAGSLATAIIGGVLFIIPFALYFGSYPAVLSEMFNTESRGTGANIGYNVGTTVLAAPLPLIVAAISAAVGGKLIPAYCVLVLAVIGLIAATTLPSARLTGRHRLDDADTDVGTDTGTDTDTDVDPADAGGPAGTGPGQRQKDYHG